MMRLGCESCAMMGVWCVVLWMMDVQVRRKKCDKEADDLETASRIPYERLPGRAPQKNTINEGSSK